MSLIPDAIPSPNCRRFKTPTESIIDDVALSVAVARARGKDKERFGTSDATITLTEGNSKFRHQHNRCSLTAIELSIDPISLGFLSLDAINPGLPHTAENTHGVCLRLNLGERTFPDSMYRAWAHLAFRGVGPSQSHDRVFCNAHTRTCGVADWFSDRMTTVCI